jgi:membrane fusion protein (multidrug efflux system)
MELRAMVPANDVPEIRAGMPVELAIDGFGDRRFKGTIERINPTTEAGTRAIIVFVQIPNADRALRGGMFATGKVTLAAGQPVPTLPQSAVRTEAGQTVIWSIDRGRLVRRQVAIGTRDPATGRVEIKTAISAELPVLAARFDNLREGAPATIKGTSGENRPDKSNPSKQPAEAVEAARS